MPGRNRHGHRNTMSAIDNDQCPVCRTADVISGKWTLLVIRDPAGESRRFCELERSPKASAPAPLAAPPHSKRRASSNARPSRGSAPGHLRPDRQGQDLVPLIDDMREYGIRWLEVEDLPQNRQRLNAGSSSAERPAVVSARLWQWNGTQASLRMLPSSGRTRCGKRIGRSSSRPRCISRDR